jgi:hypothetical protein
MTARAKIAMVGAGSRPPLPLAKLGRGDLILSLAGQGFA